MKKRQNKYKSIDKLPNGAMNVNRLGELLGFSTAHIYKMYKNGQLVNHGYDIVIFQDYNFAVPIK